MVPMWLRNRTAARAEDWVWAGRGCDPADSQAGHWWHPQTDVLIRDEDMPWELKPEGRDG